MTEQGRTGQDKAEQSAAGKAEQGSLEQGKVELGKVERSTAAQSTAGQRKAARRKAGRSGAEQDTTDTIDVLVVDDDFMVARVHRAFVERVTPFRVVGVAHTGAQAIEAAGALRPDLVLLDLYLPDLFGLDVIPRLRSAGLDCDVMVISAAQEADTVRGAVRRGVADYLLKPFDFQDLRARLERYAAQRGRLLTAVVRGQADVDRVLAGAFAPAAAPTLPKGMSAETAGLVERALRAADGTLSATECAALTGVSRVSARRYLEYFHSTGSAEVSLRYGAAGRPERRYAWRT